MGFALPSCVAATRQTSDEIAAKPRRTGGGERGEGSGSRPNFVFFFPDGFQAAAIGALGHPDVRTPNLDRLVREGTAFTNCYINGSSSAAVCVPSRAMMLTGRRLFSLNGNGGRIPEQHATMPEHFRRSGYHTFASGHWHQDVATFVRSFSHGGSVKGLVKKDGWYKDCDGHWHVPNCGFDPEGRYDRSALRHANSPIRPFNQPFTRHKSGAVHSTEVFTDPAVDYIRRADAEQPFLMYLPYVAVHDPFQSPTGYGEMYDETRLSLPPNVMREHPFDNGELRIRDEKLETWPRTEAVIRRRLKDYYAMVTHTDAQIGRVLEALEERGLVENTYIIVSADHGIANGQHGLIGKQSCYDHSMKVPLIVRGPGMARGRVSDALCYHHDIFPTLCDLAGLDTPDSVEGRSLGRVLDGSEREHRSHVHLAYRAVQRAVRDGRHKLIEYVTGDARTVQLFDLADDPWETVNLADRPEHAATVRDLRVELQKWRDEHNDRGRWSSFWESYDLLEPVPAPSPL